MSNIEKDIVIIEISRHSEYVYRDIHIQNDLDFDVQLEHELESKFNIRINLDSEVKPLYLLNFNKNMVGIIITDKLDDKWNGVKLHEPYKTILYVDLRDNTNSKGCIRHIN